MNTLVRVSVLALASFALAGCALFLGGPADQKLRRTPSYQNGYDDGCAAANNPSANFREGPSTDNSMYASDPIYRRGWASGYQMCQPTGVAPGDSPYQPMQGPTPPGTAR
jgi:hypothetical protein